MDVKHSVLASGSLGLTLDDKVQHYLRSPHPVLHLSLARGCSVCWEAGTVSVGDPTAGTVGGQFVGDGSGQEGSGVRSFFVNWTKKRKERKRKSHQLQVCG